MVDLVLLGVIGGVFYGGFLLGNKFKTVSDAIKAGLDALK